MEKDKKDSPKMMKALVLNKDLSIKVQDVPIPKPRDGEVLVKVLAAPINPSDLAFIKGHYSSQKPMPCVPGFEGSGIVVENGGGMIGWSLVNKRVALAIQEGFTGTFGQYAVVNSQQVMAISSELSLEHASMSFVNPLTAIVMLDKVKSAKIKAIIHTAAASSLGRMMNRLFTEEKIPIINVVRREEQVQLLKKEGAKYVLNSETPNFEEELTKLAKQLKATLCYDAVGGDLTGKILRALPPYSRVQIYGAMSQQPSVSGIDVSELLFKNKTLKGFWLNEELKDFGLLSKINLMRKLGNLLKHQLKSTISKEVSLDQFEEGLEYYLKNMTEGKVLIKPWQGYEEAPPVVEDKKKKEKKEEPKVESKTNQVTNPPKTEQPKIETTPQEKPAPKVQIQTPTTVPVEVKQEPQVAPLPQQVVVEVTNPEPAVVQNSTVPATNNQSQQPQEIQITNEPETQQEAPKTEQQPTDN